MSRKMNKLEKQMKQYQQCKKDLRDQIGLKQKY